MSINKPRSFQKASLKEASKVHEEVIATGDPKLIARWGRDDRFFLLTRLLNRMDAHHPWIYARCRELEANPDSHIDLWAREHYKSTLITYCGVIQEIIRNPEITICIFSFNRPNAKKFLGQIKYELEQNNKLKVAYPEIFWKTPNRQSPRWSLDRGLVVKRKTNPKEATVEAHGLVDSMPTGMHYQLRVYDDVVTEQSVGTPEMIAKTTDAWALSLNLGTEHGREQIIGTRYHFSDTYNEIIRREHVTERRYPATEDGTPTGTPVLISRQGLETKRRAMGPYIFASQMLCDPTADDAQGFKREWIRHYSRHPKYLNVYITCDPASSKKKGSDYTVFMVIGVDMYGRYYVLDVVRERMNLAGRADTLSQLHRKWKPEAVGYEKYGKDSDIEHIRYRMAQDDYRFGIIELGGVIKKEDRIRWLIPPFEQGLFFLPHALATRDREGRIYDLVQEFIEDEYCGFPVSKHDDMLDCLSRILDPAMPVIPPPLIETGEEEGDRPDDKPLRPRYRQKEPIFHGTSWMSD